MSYMVSHPDSSQGGKNGTKALTPLLTLAAQPYATHS